MTNEEMVSQTYAAAARVRSNLQNNISADVYGIEDGLVQWYEALTENVLPYQYDYFGHRQQLPATVDLSNRLTAMIHYLLETNDTARGVLMLDDFTNQLAYVLEKNPA